jgi:O-glycosyl hydrolase
VLEVSWWIFSADNVRKHYFGSRKMEKTTKSVNLVKLLAVLTALFITPLHVEAALSTATGTVNASVRYQKLEGFGAANVWSGSTLAALAANYPAIYDVIFGNLKLDILRLRNVYGYNDQSYIGYSAQVISGGRARTGRPLKILISSWSPAQTLKSCGATTCNNGTLAKDASGHYRYTDFATWWYNSLLYYSSQGINADYISMQNEPDYTTSGWDTCRFDPCEDSTFAGYEPAFQALYTKLNTAMPNHPKLLAPEAVSMTNSNGYINALTTTDKSNIYGWAHHLYGDGGSGTEPDGYISVMTSFGSTHNDKPILQTEYSDDTDVTTYGACMDLAKLIHNALTVEGVSAYLYWQLTYSSGTGLVSITSTSWTINPIYWAFKHYSYFTDVNWQRIDASTSDTTDLRISAYISPDNNQMSVMLINTATSTDINLALSFTGFNVSDGNVYQTTQSQNCVLVGAFNPSVPLTAPAYSITTIALTGTPIPMNCQEVYDYNYILPADLNGDCYVDYKDVQLMAEYWLATSPIVIPPPGHSPDIHPDSENIVNLLDFATLAAQWLTCNNPEDPNCTPNW